MFLYVFISQIWLLIVGILLGISGVLIFDSDNNNKFQNDLKFILIVLGLVYILMGVGIFNPIYLGIVIGLAMVAYGYFSLMIVKSFNELLSFYKLNLAFNFNLL